MNYGDNHAPPGVRPECADAPIAHHLFVSWPGSEGTVEVVPPPGARDRTRVCNAEVSWFADAWPTF